MKRRVGLLVFMAALAGLGAACKKADRSHPLWFSVEKDGTTTYMLGTIHRGVDAHEWLPSTVWDKLDAAPAFAMETDLRDPALPTAVARPDGSLHADLGDDYWNKLVRTLGERRAQLLDHLQPFAAAAELAMLPLPQTAPMDPTLLARAQSEHKRIVYLEPAMQELAVITKWMTTRTIKEMLDDTAETTESANNMLAAYRAGNGDAMLAIQAHGREVAKKHGHPDSELDAMQKDVIDDRNASWIDAIEKMHAAGGGFVAVGALHLVGPKSVPALLEKRGYKVTRL